MYSGYSGYSEYSEYSEYNGGRQSPDHSGGCTVGTVSTVSTVSIVSTVSTVSAVEEGRILIILAGPSTQGDDSKSEQVKRCMFYGSETLHTLAALGAHAPASGKRRCTACHCAPRRECG
jgi:hypothetical protein